jgi:diguanylate cyclase (GGDEF)-like protein
MGSDMAESLTLQNPASKFSILIVDDETANLAVLNTILHSEYAISTAKSGEAGIKLAMEKKPDLILLDIMMPGMDGFEALARLKEDPDTRKIPVIFITGLASDSDEAKGFAMGAVDYVRKPFNQELVKARVRTHIEIVGQVRASERLGLTDPLTGIPNRRHFDERVAMEWRRAIREQTSISFFMMDIDKFKTYNDTYGHPQGDALLKGVAKLFTEKVKRPGDLPARLGGEEFGILLPNTKLDAALVIAENIRAGVEGLRIPTADGSMDTKTTISIGVASMIPTKDDKIENFLSQADKNLYKAKDGGRNRICHNEGIP